MQEKQLEKCGILQTLLYEDADYSAFLRLFAPIFLSWASLLKHFKFAQKNLFYVRFIVLNKFSSIFVHKMLQKFDNQKYWTFAQLYRLNADCSMFSGFLGLNIIIIENIYIK